MRAVVSDWPMFGIEDDVRPPLSAAISAGQASVLATLSRAVGGAPFGVGAQMLFTPAGVTGFLTGGCIEADVALHAAETLEDGKPRRLVYGEGGPADVRLPCGGQIEVLVEYVGPDDGAARRLLELGAARTPVLWLSDGRTRACLAPGEPAPPAVASSLREGGGRAAMAGNRLVRRFDPVQRLVVIGQDPIALSIAKLGLFMGWPTTLARPRGPEAAPPLDGLDYIRDPDVAQALERLAPDPWTAVVLATHERDDDDRAAEAALRCGAGYVGLLGSRNRLPRRIEGLRAAGAEPRRLAQISAPVGLDIGAITPREIAASVVGEIIERARAGGADRLWASETATAA